MKISRTIILILIILFFAGFLRSVSLDKSPPSLNWDEAAEGYNAYSIMLTGRDEYGEFLPLFLRSFDDYKAGVIAYLVIPFIAVFGLNDIAVRLVSVLAGVLNVLLVFLITLKISKSNVAAFFAAFFMATAPFAVHFSRVLHETNIALSFFLLGFLLYFYRNKKFFLPLSILFFITSVYTYHTYKILVPLFLLFLFFPKKITFFKTKKTVYLSLFILLLLLPIIFETFAGKSLARFSTVSIFALWPPPILADLNSPLHNNLFYFLWELSGRYLAYFSPSNLFIDESIEPSLRIPFLAIFYPFSFIFWIVGFIYIFKNFKKFKELGILIVLSPVAAIITWNWFHSSRVLPLFAAYTILMGIGVQLIAKWLGGYKKVVLLFLVIILLGIWGSFYLLDGLIVTLPKKYYSDWQPGFKEAMPIITSLQNNYDQIVIDSPQAQPYIFTLFYSAYPPDKYLQEIDYRQVSQSPRKFYDFGKFKFRKIYWPEDRYLRKILFMGTAQSLPESDIKQTPNARIIKDVIDRDGNIEVRIVTID